MSRFQLDEKRLRELWHQGLSAKVIAARLCCSTDRITRSARRLGLPSVRGAGAKVVTPSFGTEQAKGGDMNYGI